MIKAILKKVINHLPFIPQNPQHSVEIDESGWNQQYTQGRWSYLGELSELAHYSVIVGYCQYFAREGNILDVGCGEGVLQQRLAVLPYKLYTGIDISSVAIGTAQQFKNENTEFLATDAAAYSTEQRYDAIIFNESLYCFNDCIKILRHYESLLSDNGIFIISMHDQEVSHHHWKQIGKHYRIIDSVSIINQEGTSWNCKAALPIVRP